MTPNIRHNGQPTRSIEFFLNILIYYKEYQVSTNEESGQSVVSCQFWVKDSLATLSPPVTVLVKSGEQTDPPLLFSCSPTLESLTSPGRDLQQLLLGGL